MDLLNLTAGGGGAFALPLPGQTALIVSVTESGQDFSRALRDTLAGGAELLPAQKRLPDAVKSDDNVAPVSGDGGLQLLFSVLQMAGSLPSLAGEADILPPRLFPARPSAAGSLLPLAEPAISSDTPTSQIRHAETPLRAVTTVSPLPQTQPAAGDSGNPPPAPDAPRTASVSHTAPGPVLPVAPLFAAADLLRPSMQPETTMRHPPQPAVAITAAPRAAAVPVASTAGPPAASGAANVAAAAPAAGWPAVAKPVPAPGIRPAAGPVSRAAVGGPRAPSEAISPDAARTGASSPVVGSITQVAAPKVAEPGREPANSEARPGEPTVLKAPVQMPAFTAQSHSVGSPAAAAPMSEAPLVRYEQDAPQRFGLLKRVLGERLQVQLKNQVQHATIRLDPPEMGKIDIALKLEGGRVQVQISASHAEVYRALLLTSGDLRQSLSEQHFSAVSVQVSSQSGQQHQGRGHSPDEPATAAIIAGAEMPAEASVGERHRDDSVLLTV
ncbi:flagellar hook-length control protein FliK [Pluralibacter gergoviae]|uniref:flagellar hook-length control protein FliK n=1 Tax=Pluralibacter gergoviae TaxID=61647 RepID=UPI00069D65D2|nr:flagellar hook-length control protein FliK [Pluralibacter gergoviae]